MSVLEVRFNELSLAGMLNKSQRLLLGLFVLLLVDVIWVSSSELTKYIYKNAQFEKPFFSTYVKTSMFTIYLLGLCFWPPWRDQCSKPSNYMYIDPDFEDESFYTEANTSLSDPTFVPIKFPERDRNSGTESDESTVNRSVRFSKLAEVRHMSESDATDALLARLSYQASLRAGEVARRAANKLSVESVAKIALMFCLLWFLANYTYQAALAQTETGVVTVLSSTSALFTLLLSSMFPSNVADKFTLSKLVAVCISICGLVLVSISDVNVEVKVPAGAVLSLISAFFYAVYLVFLRQKVDHEDKMDIPMFFDMTPRSGTMRWSLLLEARWAARPAWYQAMCFHGDMVLGVLDGQSSSTMKHRLCHRIKGFVGLFNLVLLWPLFFLFHYSHWELFEWPNKHQWMFLLLNGLVGTVLSEVLWLWGCFLTSSLIATVAVSLTIPLSMLADVLFEQVHYPILLYIGSLPMFIAFFAVTLLAHYDNCDPVLDVARRLYYCFCKRNRSIRVTDCEIEQTESLIGINDGEHEA